MSDMLEISTIEPGQEKFSPTNMTEYDVELLHPSHFRFDPRFLVEELISRCMELSQELYNRKILIDQLRQQVYELNEKIKYSSSGFNLPEDYYENDEYLV